MQSISADARGYTLHLAHTSDSGQTRLRGLKACDRDQTECSFYQYSDQHAATSSRCVCVCVCVCRATRLPDTCLFGLEKKRGGLISLMNCHTCHVLWWFARIIPFSFLKFSPGMSEILRTRISTPPLWSQAVPHHLLPLWHRSAGFRHVSWLWKLCRIDWLLRMFVV